MEETANTEAKRRAASREERAILQRTGGIKSRRAEAETHQPRSYVHREAKTTMSYTRKLSDEM